MNSLHRDFAWKIYSRCFLPFLFLAGWSLYTFMCHKSPESIKCLQAYRTYQDPFCTVFLHWCIIVLFWQLFSLWLLKMWTIQKCAAPQSTIQGIDSTVVLLSAQHWDQWQRMSGIIIHNWQMPRPVKRDCEPKLQHVSVAVSSEILQIHFPCAIRLRNVPRWYRFIGDCDIHGGPSTVWMMTQQCKQRRWTTTSR